MIDWSLIQTRVQACRRCEQKPVLRLRVPAAEKRRPPWEPLTPVRLYFVSVAPPWGGAYFWDETARDDVRKGLFSALRKPMGVDVDSCRQFRTLGLFLTPAVKCPSSKGENDHAPSRAAMKNCSNFLGAELTAAKAERILALGAVPFQTLCDIFGIDAPTRVKRFRGQVWWVRLGEMDVPFAGTYFPGNNRHKGFDKIVEDIDGLLRLEPRVPTAL